MGIYDDEKRYEIIEKDDKSPLTDADTAANDVICRGLEILSPNVPIISEERKMIPYEQRRNYDYCWMVDPLDGTKEFIKRNGEFTVNIALLKQGKPTIGVIYVPVTRTLFYAEEGNGAREQKDALVMPLETDVHATEDKGLRVVCSRSHLNEKTSDYLDRLNEPELVATGSSLKFMLIAQGKADLYPRLAPTMEWDTAAAQIILEEAGGQVLTERFNSATSLQ